ncbi:MAG: hypothetical protein V7631_4350 [Massilia sp.]|jgi:hypothetical protein
MTWKTTTFERQKLFDEVWSTPISKLAKEYELSDVGLRKICVTLDIPLPPRGYWQKLAAGKTIPKPPLRETTVATSYTRATYIAHVDQVLEERIVHARDELCINVEEDTNVYFPPADSTSFSKEAKMVGRAMKGTKVVAGALSISGVTWTDVSVSPDLKERALLLVDRFAHELEALGAKFENSCPPSPPLRRGARRASGSNRNCFVLHGQRFFLQIRERIVQELVPPPPLKPQKTPRTGIQPPWEYRPPEYRYIPTGKVYASIVDAATYYESCKLEDTARGNIETKVKKAVCSVGDTAIRRNVESALREERALIRRKKAQDWEVAKKNKEALLAQLAAFEKLSKDLDRARSLRRFIDEIATSKGAPAELVRALELMALMADWLDPLVKAPWPEVDAVAENNPFGSGW